jgi:hypothetical protein
MGNGDGLADKIGAAMQSNGCCRCRMELYQCASSMDKASWRTVRGVAKRSGCVVYLPDMAVAIGSDATMVPGGRLSDFMGGETELRHPRMVTISP